MKFSHDLKIVCIGGGSGLFSLLSGLKKYADNKDNITAVVTITDSGGSTGKLVTQYGMLPPGDLRNCMIALSDQSSMLAKLFAYRFDERMDNHNFGNLLIKVLQDITGDFDSAIKAASDMLQIHGKVLPVSLEKNTLIAKTTKGDVIEGEEDIDLIKDKIIDTLHLKEQLPANPEALDALKNADVIIVGPGDLYSSILPNILFNDISKVIRENNDALKIGIAPIMTKPGETHDFTLKKWVEEVEKYLGESLSHVLCNNAVPDDEIISRYEKEGKELLILNGDLDLLESRILILEDFLNHDDVLRHSREKIGICVYKLISDLK